MTKIRTIGKLTTTPQPGSFTSKARTRKQTAKELDGRTLLNQRKTQNLALNACMMAILLAAQATAATLAYVTNPGSNTVSVIDTATNTVVGSPISLGHSPGRIAMTPDGARAYVAYVTPNFNDSGVLVISTSSNTVTATIPIAGACADGVAVHPDGTRVYVADVCNGVIQVVNTATNTLAAPIPVGAANIAVAPDGTRAYLTIQGSVSVLDLTSNTVTGTVPVTYTPVGLAVAPDGTRVYVTTFSGGNTQLCNVQSTIEAIDTSTKTVAAKITLPANSLTGLPGITPDGSRLYAPVLGLGCNGTTGVNVVTTSTNTIAASIPIAALNVAVTPDGTRAYAIGGNTVTAIDTATNSVLSSVTIGDQTSNLFGIAMTPAYRFNGFSAPVSNSAVNVAKAGQTVAVNFGLGGNVGLNIFASGYPASQQIACPLSPNTSTITETSTAGNSGLSYNPLTQTYSYAWKTDKAWANTCRRLTVMLNDPSHTTRTADFMFSR